MLTKYALMAVIALCITVQGFTLLVRDSLCDSASGSVALSLRQLSLTNRRSRRYAGSYPRVSACLVWMRRHPLNHLARSQSWLRANFLILLRLPAGTFNGVLPFMPAFL